MTRLSEQEKLFVSWRTLQPKSSVKQKTNDNEVVPSDTVYCPKKDFKPSVNDRLAASGIEELEDNISWKSRSRKQQTLCQMSKKMESSALVSDVSFSNFTNESPNKSNVSNNVMLRKASKRKAESVSAKSLNNECTLQSQRKKVRSRKPKNAVVEQSEELSINSQSLVDKAGNDLLEDLEDFEGDANLWNPFITKDRKSPLAKFGAERREIKYNDKEISPDAQKYSGSSLTVSRPVIEKPRTNLENEKESEISTNEEQRNAENSDEDNLDFFENNEESQDLLNGLQRRCSVGVKSMKDDKIVDKDCKNVNSDLLKNNVRENEKYSAEQIHKTCSQLQTQEKSASCGKLRVEEICNDSIVSSNHSVSAKLKRFSFALNNASNSPEKTQNSLYSEKGQKNQTVEKDNVDTENKAPLPEKLSVSTKEQQSIILPFKKPSFLLSQGIRNVPAFPSCRPQFAADSLSEELDDVDFELNL